MKILNFGGRSGSKIAENGFQVGFEIPHKNANVFERIIDPKTGPQGNLTGQEREAPVHVRCGYNVVRMDAFLYAGVRINKK